MLRICPYDGTCALIKVLAAASRRDQTATMALTTASASADVSDRRRNERTPA
jgi:hypothetical protein